MQIHSLPLGAAFGALNISVSPVTLYTTQHCAHKRCFIRHYRRDEMEMKSTNHRRLASRKGGVWKNESLSESFGSRWASKVKINAYYKTIKVFFDLACMSTCCWGLPKPKYEPFITHNRGTLNFVVELDFYTKLNAFNSDRLSQTKCTKNTWRGIKLRLLTFLWGQNKLPEIVSLCFLCLKEWQEPEGGRSLTRHSDLS